jgi:hypothetical protein
LTSVNISKIVIFNYEKEQFRKLKRYVDMKVSELTSIINGAVVELKKAQDEIVSKQVELYDRIQVLEGALVSAGDVPAEALAAIEELKTVAQSLDGIVPDIITPVEPIPVPVDEPPVEPPVEEPPVEEPPVEPVPTEEPPVEEPPVEPVPTEEPPVDPLV